MQKAGLLLSLFLLFLLFFQIKSSAYYSSKIKSNHFWKMSVYAILLSFISLSCLYTDIV